MGHPDESSTTADLPTTARGPLERWGTQAGLFLLTAVVVVAALGFLGPRSAEVSATDGDYELEVEYPSIIRAGQPAPLHVRVGSAGGFDGPIELALCDDFFDHLDFQSWYPTPSEETGTATELTYEFDPPDGDVFEVSLDARAAPGQFGGIEDCTIAVLRNGSELASVTFKSWRMP